MSRSSLRLRGSLFSVLLVSLVWLGCADSRDVTAPDDLGPNIRVVDQVALDRAIRVQEAHTDEMFEIAGVMGTGVGLTADGQLAVKIFTTEAGVAGLLPESLEDVPVAVEVTGMIFALRAMADPTAEFPRPVPIGVSTGHPSITAGTIGARLRDAAGNVYALSNNHIYADMNDASIGDGAIQPGAFDGGSDPADRIGTLFDYERIRFAKRRNVPTNDMDAAIVLSSIAMLGYATPVMGGYGAPSATPADASLGLAVMKYGRTTKLTSGQVSAINMTVDVCYAGFVVCTSWARFVDQIVITPGAFSGGGDSGSLIVTQSGNNPVALLFAGSSSHTIASPIDPILQRFNVTIDDGGTPPPPPPPPPPLGGVDVTSINPNSMLAGTTLNNVTITGSGFEVGAEVTFENGSGPAPTAVVVSVSGTSITAQVTVKNGGPRGTRVWDVRVTNTNSSSDVLPDSFTVTK